MTFQFQCPNGHTLEGDASQAGQQCNCPMCGMLFIIPAPVAPAPTTQAPAPFQPPSPGPQPAPPRFPAPPAPQIGAAQAFPPAPASQAPGSFAPPPSPGPPAFPQPSAPAPQAESPAAPGPMINTGESTSPAVDVAQSVAEPDLLHIPCPNGHELETPKDMIGQDVLCPHCEVQFRLREKDSVEFKRKKQRDEEIRDRKTGNAWFNWAVVVAVIVLLGLIIMIASTSH